MTIPSIKEIFYSKNKKRLFIFDYLNMTYPIFIFHHTLNNVFKPFVKLILRYWCLFWGMESVVVYFHWSIYLQVFIVCLPGNIFTADLFRRRQTAQGTS